MSSRIDEPVLKVRAGREERIDVHARHPAAEGHGGPELDQEITVRQDADALADDAVFIQKGRIPGIFGVVIRAALLKFKHPPDFGAVGSAEPEIGVRADVVLALLPHIEITLVVSVQVVERTVHTDCAAASGMKDLVEAVAEEGVDQIFVSFLASGNCAVPRAVGVLEDGFPLAPAFSMVCAGAPVSSVAVVCLPDNLMDFCEQACLVITAVEAFFAVVAAGTHTGGNADGAHDDSSCAVCCQAPGSWPGTHSAD